jgi:hypothetical protein
MGGVEVFELETPQVLRGRGGSRKLAVALLGAHTLPKNPPPISGMQAYIAYLISSLLRAMCGGREYEAKLNIAKSV